MEEQKLQGQNNGQQQPQGQPPQGGKPPAGQTPGGKPEGGKQGTPGPVPYDRFREILEAKKSLEARLTEIEAEQRKAEEERLKQQNEWKTLAEKYESELRQTRRQMLATRIAQETGLPMALAERLQGDTEEALREDAKRLAELLKTAPAHGVPPSGGGAGGAGAPDLASMSPEEVRKWARENLGMG